MASSSASSFSPGERTGRPNASNSASLPPAPSPRISRPPESRSRVSAIFAITTGFRYGSPSTLDPTEMRDVEAAIHVRSVHVSYDGRSPWR